MSTKNCDLKAVEERAPTSVVLLLRWLAAVTLTHNISMALASEEKPPPADPVADKLFDDIDTNGDGQLQLSELIAYLLKSYPTSMAHKMIRLLDSDMDKMVSRDEWRRGWADGLLTDLFMKEREKEENKLPEGGRMAGRRSSAGRSAALQAGLAAQEYQKRMAAGGGGGGGGSDEGSSKSVDGKKKKGKK